MVLEETTTKLFYNIYPYRITYPRLGRLHRFYFQGNEPSNHSMEMRQKCLTYLKKEFKGNIKFNHGYHTHAYFLKEEDFEKAKSDKESQQLHIKYTTPLFSNLKEILDKFDANITLRKTLFLRKFKYKVEIKFNFQNFRLSYVTTYMPHLEITQIMQFQAT